MRTSDVPKLCFFAIFFFFLLHWGTQYHSWLRHYATGWKIAGSTPDVVDILNFQNSSSRTVALG
jgi:hypothetical protein